MNRFGAISGLSPHYYSPRLAGGGAENPFVFLHLKNFFSSILFLFFFFSTNYICFLTMTDNVLDDISHRRFNPLRGSSILVSPHRTKRPWQ